MEGMCHFASAEKTIVKNNINVLNRVCLMRDKNNYRLTCRPSPLQSGLSFSVHVPVAPLNVPCMLMKNRGRASAE